MLKSLTLIAALVCGSAAVAQTVEVRTFRGLQQAEAQPEKVAVFDLAALDTLVALGVKPAGVIGNLYVDYLDKGVEGAEVVGSLFEPDFESIYALQPDLILVGGRSSDQAEALADFAPTLDMTIDGDDLVQIALHRLEDYGHLFGKEAEATALRDSFLTKLEATKSLARGKGTALLIMTNGPKISAFGAMGRFGWLHSKLEVPQAAEGLGENSHGEAISSEFIRDANPDYLFVVDRLSAIGQGGEDAKATLDNDLVRQTSAWKNGHVIYLDAASLYIAGGGIQSMNRVLDQLISAYEGNG
ncbi:putative ABC transporter, periplasmic Fe+3 siderophore binding protein [Roseobacter sp. MED193]|uniref:siderophore ABC transporter substrate-binding protein n=1 Tax=Roseobacter sp. MED193 TaxID=314262 RepID=UPI000068E001|nr:siderophore ABC transporter substrate-binding protein [Roseobacter sp. MED193]EAQ45586.1 putative ABC transporter, periplasmic Fe+3 siderophore binding protein [Roseobacter sp. MED193]